MMTPIRDETTERIETTIEIGTTIIEVAAVEIVRVREIAGSSSTSPSPPHPGKRTYIGTDPKRIERPGAVLENKLTMAPTAVDRDLTVRVTSPPQTSEGEEVHVIRMLLRPLTVHFLDLLTLTHVRIRTPVLHLPLKMR